VKQKQASGIRGGPALLFFLGVELERFWKSVFPLQGYFTFTFSRLHRSKSKQPPASCPE
jgi:hypothetical protein